MTAPTLIAERAPEPSWQAVLRDAVRDLDELAALLELEPGALKARGDRDAEFPLLVPRGFLARMRRGDPHDPLLLQVLPQRAERAAMAGYVADPLREVGLAAEGMLQKYQGRALLIASAACPVHCRYCFRREFPYQAQLASRGDWQAVLRRLAERPDINELILSGGDPLSVSNRRLAALLEGLDGLAGLDCLRLHTRFPIMVPERIDAELVSLFGATRLKVVVVIHCNHARELDVAVEAALARLGAGVDLLLNQSVLLRAVNDDVAVLEALSRRLFDCGVLPYYLHMLDPVSGTAHFAVDDAEARRLGAGLRARLPGYLVPRLVRETPGELSKMPL